MKNFLTNNFAIIFSLLLVISGFYGIKNPIGITHEVRMGTIIAKDSTDVKIGKNSFRKQYRFALKYKDIESEVIIVNLAKYTEKEIGQNFERNIEYYSTSYYIVFWISCIFIALGSIGTLACLLCKIIKD